MDNKQNIQLSIIIVNYNVRYFLEQCLHSVLDACININAEVIVVDNNSHDSSCEMIQQKFPHIKLIANKENTGFSKANNQGIAIAKGEYILILNPDTVVAEDTFEQILNFAKNKQNLGALGVKLIDGTGAFLPESKRGIPTPKVSFNKLTGISSKHTGKYYASHLQENEAGVIEILVGAFMLIKRSIYSEVNGFDEDYFMYGEDIDLSYKIHKKGYQNYYYPQTKIIHYKGESTKKDVKYLKYFYGAMNIFYRKHFKLNKIYDFLMSLGIRFWYSLQYLKLKKTTSATKPISRFVYIGKNEATFAKIKNLFSADLAVFHTDISIPNIISNKIDTIIFDNNTISNKDIINSIELLHKKEKNFRFQFIPKGSDFIIGSDNAINKGDVLSL